MESITSDVMAPYLLRAGVEGRSAAKLLSRPNGLSNARLSPARRVGTGAGRGPYRKAETPPQIKRMEGGQRGPSLRIQAPSCRRAQAGAA
jgi:hypothetical protein